MRILHVFDHSLPLHSGYTFRSRAILREQHALDWDTVQLTSPKQGPCREATEQADGLTFHRTPIPNGWASHLPVLNHLTLMRALERQLETLARKIKPDILHAHSPALNGLPALRVGQRLAIPVVYEVRAIWEDAAVDHGTSRPGGLRYRFSRALETRVLKRAGAVTVICEGLRQEITTRGIDSDKITVIPNAVDIEAFTAPTAPDATLAATLDLGITPVVGFIGSFYAYEGLSLLLDALALVRDQGVPVTALLVGGGPEEAHLKAQAEALDLVSLTRFTGRVPHHEVARYYSLIDILVYPRLPMRLTDLVTPLKPLEAMAQEGLVLASDVGGHRELIRDGETGVLFPAGKARGLAQALIDLLQRRADWPRLRRGGRHFVETERTWRASVARYQAVYDALKKR